MLPASLCLEIPLFISILSWSLTLLTAVIPEDELLCLPCYYDCIKNVPFSYVYWVVQEK